MRLYEIRSAGLSAFWRLYSVFAPLKSKISPVIACLDTSVSLSYNQAIRNSRCSRCPLLLLSLKYFSGACGHGPVCPDLGRFRMPCFTTHRQNVLFQGLCARGPVGIAP
jgi:hypothetical protein